VLVLVGLTDWLPLKAREAVHVAEQLVALLAVQLRVVDWPIEIDVELALRLTEGGSAGVADTKVDGAETFPAASYATRS
jgi:hypothetical protein